MTANDTTTMRKTTMERAAWDCVYGWMREPDYVENASLEWLIDWINRRPIMHIVECQPDNPDRCSPDQGVTTDVSEAVEAERDRCLRILAMRAKIWRDAVKEGAHEDCAMSLWEECEDIAAAINNGLNPPVPSGLHTQENR